MRKLNVKTAKTVKESSGLVKVYSNHTLTKFQLLEIIDNTKKLEEDSIDALKQIVGNYDKKEYHTKLGKLSEKISSIGETAYQRAIFLSEKTKLNTMGEVIWNDLELPVVFNENPRRSCVDLIGTLANNTPVLCELKFASKKGDSPIYAAIELLIYYYLIQDNYEELDEKNVFHKNEQVKPFKWKDFNHNSVFIVGANESYWEYWKKHYEKRKTEIELWCESLPVTIRFFSSPNFDFKKQKGSKEKYQPSVSDKTEWTEVYL